MAILTLNLSTVELESTLRPMGANGAPGSLDYNDQITDFLADLATLSEFINDTIIPLMDSLPAGALLPVVNPVGIEGRTVFTDTSNQTPLFFNATSATPLTISQTVALLNGMIQGLSTTVTGLGLQVTTLSSQLSISNQNSIAQAIQAITSSMNSITAQVAALQSTSTITDQFTQTDTGVIAPGATGIVSIAWTTPMSSNAYNVGLALQDESGYLRILGFFYDQPGLSIGVRVQNTSDSSGIAGTVNATAHLL